MFATQKKPAHNIEIRDTLFGDLPLEYWATIESREVPWNLFKDVKKLLIKERTLKQLKF